MKALVRVLLTRSGIAAAAGLFTLSVGVIAQQPATPRRLRRLPLLLRPLALRQIRTPPRTPRTTRT